MCTSRAPEPMCSPWTTKTDRKGGAPMRDRSMSNGGKVRLGARDVGRLTFHVHVPSAGAYVLAVDYEDRSERWCADAGQVHVERWQGSPGRQGRRAVDLPCARPERRSLCARRGLRRPIGKVVRRCGTGPCRTVARFAWAPGTSGG